MSSLRRFPSPWTVEEDEAYFVVRDYEGQQLAYVHIDNPTAAAKPSPERAGPKNKASLIPGQADMGRIVKGGRVATIAG
jgi:hypothetical protein